MSDTQNYIINIDFNGQASCTAPSRYQYNFGQKIRFTGIPNIPAAYETHFANAGQTTPAERIMNNGEFVDVPNYLFTSGADIYAWIYVHDTESDGETLYKARIPIINRPMPGDYSEQTEEIDILAQAISLYNDTIGEAQGYAQDASGSADNAAASATLSESWAVGGTGTRQDEDTDNAKHYAEVAQQGAEHSGYAYFEIDNTDGKLYVTITDPLSEEVSFEINETTGKLEVIVQ